MDLFHSTDDSRHLIEQRAALYERAKAEASRLRAQAVADLFSGTDVFVRDAARRALRASNRLAARLRQHAKQRALGA